MLAASGSGLSAGALLLAIAGGSSLGAIFTAIFAGAKESVSARQQRRGGARLIHEDLYRLQSTLTRMYYKPESEWRRVWILDELAKRDDYLNVLSALKEPKLGAVSSALGWAQYLRSTKPLAGLDDGQLRTCYESFAGGRQAIRGWTSGEFRPHHQDRVVPPADRIRNRESSLEEFPGRP